MPRLVMKFGGTSVADVQRIRNVAAHVKREIDAGAEIAVVVSAIIALFFVVMMPARQDSAASFTATVRSFTTALSQQPSQPLPVEEAKKPALAEFQSLLAASDTAQAAEHEQADKQSDKLLQQFMQWRQNQKTAPNEPAQ